MSAVDWALVWVAWLLVVALVLAVRRARRVPPVAGLIRQESTDQLPISLALYAAWAHPGRNTPEQHEAVKARIRELHPDLATALDRAVAAGRDRATTAANVPVPRPALVALAACKRGEHEWHAVEGMPGTEGCRVCHDLRATVA